MIKLELNLDPQVHFNEADRATLSEAEQVSICRSFDSGIRGCLIIGIRNGRKVLPQFLPESLDEATTEQNLSACLDRVRRIGCARYLIAERIVEPKQNYHRSRVVISIGTTAPSE